MRFRTILFDLDGTLIDHFEAIHRCHAFTRRALGMPEPSMAEVRAAVGAGIETALARLDGAERVAEALPIYLRHWEATMLEDVRALPGAAALLRSLQDCGVGSGVLTNKRGSSARQICAHLGLGPLLKGIFGAGDTPWLKPDVRFTTHVLSALQAQAETTCLIGDSPYDLETAEAGRLAFVAVATGTHTVPELRAAGARHIASSLSEVGRFLENL
ncbi:MAG TPA: HAD family hydrolase [Candidatus Didemnitutus sp.]|nr:HAD family hydrolase [Candidatus Didemnitutus sp.]